MKSVRQVTLLVLTAFTILYNLYGVYVKPRKSIMTHVTPNVPLSKTSYVGNEIKTIHKMDGMTQVASDVTLSKTNYTVNELKTILRVSGATREAKEGIITHGEHKCRLIYRVTALSEADLVAFCEDDIHHYKNPPHRDPQQLWAFYSKEPQSDLHYPKGQVSKWNGLFNYSATYLRSNEGNRYIFRPDLLKKSQPARHDFTPKPKMRPLRVLWFVSHCTKRSKQHRIFSAREEYVLELSKYVTIDIYTLPKTKNCKRRFKNLIKSQNGVVQPSMDEYMFYLSFENSLCKDYVSEKLWKVLESNSTTIPIALGGSSIEDYEYVAPPNSFIHVKNFTSPEALANHLKFVSQDDNAFHYYNQWRNEYDLDTSRHKMHNDRQYVYNGKFFNYFCKLANERPHRVWDTFSEDYHINQCKDVSKPKDYCPYYNLSCNN